MILYAIEQTAIFLAFAIPLSVAALAVLALINRRCM